MFSRISHLLVISRTTIVIGIEAATLSYKVKNHLKIILEKLSNLRCSILGQNFEKWLTFGFKVMLRSYASTHPAWTLVHAPDLLLRSGFL